MLTETYGHFGGCDCIILTGVFIILLFVHYINEGRTEAPYFGSQLKAMTIAFRLLEVFVLRHKENMREVKKLKRM